MAGAGAAGELHGRHAGSARPVIRLAGAGRGMGGVYPPGAAGAILYLMARQPDELRGIVWFGCGKKKLAFSFRDDLELFHETKNQDEKSETDPIPDQAGIDRLFPDRRGKYSFFDISRHSGLDSRNLTEKLWDLAWSGEVSNDSFAVVRKGILNKFASFKPQSRRSRSRRAQFSRWKATRPIPGNWFATDDRTEENETDIIEEQELLMDRVRQLLRRYGVLFRGIVAGELPLLGWGKLFKTLRRMELSGEILSGYFFEGVPGLQFISNSAFRFLNQPLPEDAVYWMNAADPASPCGTGLKGLSYKPPHRLTSTHLVFHGVDNVLVSRRNGGDIDIHVPPDHPFLLKYLSFFKVLPAREFNPRRSVMTETINGENAIGSDYAKIFKGIGFVEDYKGLELRRNY